jgi:hypothetical protein
VRLRLGDITLVVATDVSVGDVTDRIGDALPNATGVVSPDLASATISVSGGNPTPTVNFAPGTLS